MGLIDGQAVTAARDSARELIQKWHATRPQRFEYQTYRRIMAGDGYFQSSKRGESDCNIAILMPLLDPITEQWEQCFHQEIHRLIDDFASQYATALDKYPQTLLQSLRKMKSQAQSNDLALFTTDLTNRRSTMQNDVRDAVRAANLDLSDVERVAENEVRRQMCPYYSAIRRSSCVRGNGALRRMQEDLETFVLGEDGDGGPADDIYAAVNQAIVKQLDEHSHKLYGMLHDIFGKTQADIAIITNAAIDALRNRS